MVNTAIKISILYKKKDIILLSTLFLNKISITKYIDILKEYLKKHEIEEVTILNKLFIFKGNYFTIYRKNIFLGLNCFE